MGVWRNSRHRFPDGDCRAELPHPTASRRTGQIGQLPSVRPVGSQEPAPWETQRGKSDFMLVRAFKNGDEPALQAVFYSAVHTVAAKDYSLEQLDAWAPHRPDWDAWTARMQALQPFVVETDRRLVGYADLQTSGYVDHFFVAGTHARRGVGRLLMERLHARAAELGLARLYSDVSRTAEPFFERFGFCVVEHKNVVIGQVSLPHVRMDKALATGAASP